MVRDYSLHWSKVFCRRAAGDGTLFRLAWRQLPFCAARCQGRRSGVVLNIHSRSERRILTTETGNSALPGPPLKVCCSVGWLSHATYKIPQLAPKLTTAPQTVCLRQPHFHLALTQRSRTHQMSSREYPLRQSGIYRNLPSFSPSLKGLSAIVVGATGISGFNTIRSLLDVPGRWTTIYAVSRSPFSAEMLSLMSEDQQSRIKHVSVDLTGPAADTAAALEAARVQAEYVFFYGYIHPRGKQAMDPAMADALVEANVPIFEKFLQALDLARIKPKRILLQTGGKNYGGHIGRARLPYIESDPQPRHLSNNFYFPQEDALHKFCAEHPSTSWNVIRPFGVVGAAPNAGMNTFLPFAIMAAVQAEKSEPIFFGGDLEGWLNECCHSSARLTGYLSEWAVLEDECKDQAFNAQDGSPMSWDRFFEELARWYSVEKGIEGPELDDNKFHTIQLAGGKDSPLGYGSPPSIKISRTLAEWSEDPENQQAWRKLMEASGGKLKVDPFEQSKGTDLFFGDWAFYKIGQPSVAKLRRFGFSGFVDTVESVFEMYKDMAQMGIVPPPNVDDARSSI